MENQVFKAFGCERILVVILFPRIAIPVYTLL
jgi:hypothetical protein